MHIAYYFSGNALNKAAAMEAVKISQERYCGISHMLKKVLPLTWEIYYNNVQVFDNRIAQITAMVKQ